MDEQESVRLNACRLSLPVYVAVVLVALFPRALVVATLAPLQVEAFLTAAVLVRWAHPVWLFTHHAPSRGEQR